jgi:acetyl-CoA decarbonylase/synthase complex subunit gamma
MNLISAGKPAILFLCTGNSCRSQMAEGWARHIHGHRIDTFSAGIEAHGLNPYAVRVMGEAGVDISGHRSKLVSELDISSFDLVITVCDRASGSCPVLPGVPVFHRPFPDPPKMVLQLGDTPDSNSEDYLNCYRVVRDEIRSFVEDFLFLLNMENLAEPLSDSLRVQTLHGSATVPRVKTALSFDNHLGALKVRLGFNRMNYGVPAGLYAVGYPDSDSPVLVTSNYRLTFDSLRCELTNENCWILVLDTQRVNVWCAAAKGTFGTVNLVESIQKWNLTSLVNHREIIVPQLGAPGISAHSVRRVTGFRVIYGPVESSDLVEFMACGMNSAPKMRSVDFPFWRRVILIPIEFRQSLWQTFYITLSMIILAVAAVIQRGDGYYGKDCDLYESIVRNGLWFSISGLLAGTVMTPILLPHLPSRIFSIKGLFARLIFVFVGKGHRAISFRSFIGGTLISAAWSSFTAMKFTGCTPFTSQSGVEWEMKRSIPLQILAGISGFFLWYSGWYFAKNQSSD